MLKKASLFLMLVCLFSSCESEEKKQKKLGLQLIPTACKFGGEPNLFVSEAGTAYLSWIEYLDDTTDVFFFSTLEQDRWSEKKEIARGHNWFVNWADFPSLAAYQNKEFLAAHWLQKSDSGTYDYDIRVAQSINQGLNWQENFVLHRDSIAAEHGFVTLVALPNQRIFATWLDGRNTKMESAKESHGNGGHHGHGAGGMTLRTAEFDINNKLHEEQELDHLVCDCCQTDAALTDNGPVVVYRDRSKEEIRDISIVRKVNGIWTQAQNIFPDNWKTSACPVNGPAIVANGNFLAVVWYTAAAENPKINLSFSNDAGQSFSTPIQVDDGRPIGRVDLIELASKEVLVTWVELVEDHAEIRVARFNEKSKIGKSKTAVEINSSRASGFPILEKMGTEVLLAWTASIEESTQIKTAFLKNY